MVQSGISLTVVMKDGVYAERLARGLSAVWKELHIRTEKNLGFLAREENAGAILTDWETYSDKPKTEAGYTIKGKKTRWFLLEEPRPGYVGKVEWIEPYRTAREIGADLLKALGWKRRTSAEMDDEVVIVLSASGGVGTSAVAAALAKELSGLGTGPVLTLSLDSFPKPEKYFSGTGSGKLFEDFTDAFRSDRENCLPEAFFGTDENGVRYFSYGGRFNSFYDLSEEERTDFLNGLFDSMDSGYLVLDASAPNLRELDAVLLCANRIVLVGDGTKEDMQSGEKLMDMLHANYEFDGIYRVINRRKECGFSDNDEISFLIGYDPESFALAGILPSFLFRKEVKRIAETIIGNRNAKKSGPDYCGGPDPDESVGRGNR